MYLVIFIYLFICLYGVSWISAHVLASSKYLKFFSPPSLDWSSTPKRHEFLFNLIYFFNDHKNLTLWVSETDETKCLAYLILN